MDGEDRNNLNNATPNKVANFYTSNDKSTLNCYNQNMITVKEIEKLANLARIKLEDSEKDGLAKEIDSILSYVDQIKVATVNMDYTPLPGAVKNVFREDIAINTSDSDREGILKESPDREGDFVAVKKIIAQD
jgi:aspartyl-tRNA(Asn)/glutamyl-tRNA(Gln) amidotransferase subunit C